jgi:hypothetical protein
VEPLDATMSAEAFVEISKEKVLYCYLRGLKIILNGECAIVRDIEQLTSLEISDGRYGGIAFALNGAMVRIGSVVVETERKQTDPISTSHRLRTLLGAGMTEEFRLSQTRLETYKDLHTFSLLSHGMAVDSYKPEKTVCIVEKQKLNPFSGDLSDTFGESFVANYPWFAGLLERLNLCEGDTMLDFGCGLPPWAAAVASLKGMEPWGCDIFPEDVGAESMAPWGHYIRGDITHPPKIKQFFDFILCRNITPFVYAPHFEFEEFQRFRDSLIESLTDKGSLCLYISVNLDDMDAIQKYPPTQEIYDVYTWLSGEFPYCEIFFCEGIYFHGSRRPLKEVWQNVTSSGDDEENLFEYLTKYVSTEEAYIQTLMRVAQHIWPRHKNFGQEKLVVWGDSKLAKDMFVTVNVLYRHMFDISLCGPEAHDFPEPGVIVFDTIRNVGTENTHPHVIPVTTAEILARMTTGEFDLVGSYDKTIARRILIERSFPKDCSRPEPRLKQKGGAAPRSFFIKHFWSKLISGTNSKSREM